MRRNKYDKNITERICYKCLLSLPLEKFVKDKGKLLGRGYICKVCGNDKNAFYGHKRCGNPDKLSCGLRWKILHKYNFTCQYCGRKAPEVILEVDHIVPLSKGGKYIEDNLTLACKECNIGKSNFLL